MVGAVGQSSTGEDTGIAQGGSQRMRYWGPSPPSLISHPTILHMRNSKGRSGHPERPSEFATGPVKIGNVLHCPQTGIGTGVIVLREKGFSFLWPDFGNLGIYLNQRCDKVYPFKVL